MHDDFGAEKFSAFVPRRMLYTTHKWQGLLVFVHLSVCDLCLCCKKYSANCLGIFGFALILCILVFVHLCICVFICVCVQAYVITGTWQGHHLGRNWFFFDHTTTTPLCVRIVRVVLTMMMMVQRVIMSDN